MKKSIGLLVVVQMPTVGLMAVLQRRGRGDEEKEWRPETYPGVCQVTAHGGLEKGENFPRALVRETTKELGKDFCENLVGNSFYLAALFNTLSSPSYVRNAFLDSVEENGKQIKTLVIRAMSHKILSDIRFHPSSGGLELLKLEKEEINRIGIVKNYDRAENGRYPRGIIMFPDEKKVLQKAHRFFMSQSYT